MKYHGQDRNLRNLSGGCSRLYVWRIRMGKKEKYLAQSEIAQKKEPKDKQKLIETTDRPAG
jgi:hypothetical protein